LYHAALAAGGPKADICFALAELFYRLGELTAARERYFMAIELDESFVEARANLGCLLAEQGQLPMALAALEGALRYHPDYADAHYHLAKTLHQLDRRDEAVAHWKAFLRLSPDSPWAAEVRLLLALSGEDNVEPI
jgi:tetratricopeptide (TPR) repeat protein